MKLNVKRIILIGLAFFSIQIFWQVYDSIMPKILTTHFGLGQTVSGLIMGLDNLLALFIIPLFGTLSDKTKTKMGKRTPYVLIGTILSVVLFVSLSFVDNIQIDRINKVDMYQNDEALEILWNEDLTIENPDYDFIKATFQMESDPKEVKLSSIISKEEFLSIKAETNDGKPSPEYLRYVVPARSAYAKNTTKQHMGVLVMFVLVLFLLLLSMATYRSPAVSLMPDITIKPNRARANSIINLMGGIGGAIVVGLGFVFKTGLSSSTSISYTGFFSTAAIIMLLAIILYLLTVNENKFVKEREELEKKFKIKEEKEKKGNRELTKEEKKSLIKLLLTVALAFMGFNAINSKYTVYAEYVLHIDYNKTLMFSMAVAGISFVPLGIISDKIGRKKTTVIAIIGLSVCYTLASFLDSSSKAYLMNMLFAFAGVCWAAVNVNIYPMVTELCQGSDLGKYTGYYYSASMAAQFLTPLLSGVLMDLIGFRTLFPYAAVCSVLSLIMIVSVKHGDYKENAKAK